MKAAKAWEIYKADKTLDWGDVYFEVQFDSRQGKIAFLEKVLETENRIEQANLIDMAIQDASAVALFGGEEPDVKDKALDKCCILFILLFCIGGIAGALAIAKVLPEYYLIVGIVASLFGYIGGCIANIQEDPVTEYNNDCIKEQEEEEPDKIVPVVDSAGNEIDVRTMNGKPMWWDSPSIHTVTESMLSEFGRRAIGEMVNCLKERAKK